MLTYREIDYKADIPQIISLLRTSLSENHTEESFLWKHYKNPFGISYGLLACDEKVIVGVRMFMFWEFKKGGEIVKAIRPVDTITHPDYRGKGIFKQLTLQGLENCREEYALVYNTPNQNSFPGYIKMGWKEMRNKPVYKFGIIWPRLLRGWFLEKVDGNTIVEEDLQMDNTYFQTNISINFIRWRYSSSDYRMARITVQGEILLIIFRMIKLKKIKCLVIIDVIGKPSLQVPAIKFLALREKIFFTYYLEDKKSALSFFLAKKRQEPVIVYKDDSLGITENIKFSAGDLEGRL